MGSIALYLAKLVDGLQMLGLNPQSLAQETSYRFAQYDRGLPHPYLVGQPGDADCHFI